MKNKQGLYKLLFLLVGLLVLGYMVYKIGFDTILNGLTQVGISFVWIMLVWLVVYVLNAWSWDIIIRSESKNNRPSFLNVLRITISGFAINYLTPIANLGGEPYKIMELKPYTGVNKATSSVVLYSMMHMFTHVTFWICSVVLAYFYLKPSLVPSLLLLALLILLLFIAWLFMQAYKKGLIMASFKIVSKLPFLNKYINKFVDKHRHNLEEIDEQIAGLHNKRKSAFYWSYMVEFVSRFVGCLEVNLILWALADMFPGMNINIIDGIIITAGYSLFANAVFFVPLQIGSREGGYMLTFEALGLASAPAMIVSLVTRIRELLWIFIGLILIKVGKKRTDKLEINE